MNCKIGRLFLTLFLTFAAVVGSDSEIVETTDRDIELGPETADKVICSRLAFLRICLAVAFTFLITIAIFLVQAVKKKQEDHSHAQIGPDAYLFKERIRHKEFKFVKKLGSGAYGQVYAAVNNRDGGLFAVKSTWLKGKNINAFKNTQREIDLLSKLEHENIVRYLGSHQDSEHFYMYMELVAGGSLEDFLTSEADSRKQLSPSVAQSYSKQILTGLAYLHENGVIHRDLKPGNALVTIGGKMKLADFGASFDMTNLEHSTKQTTIGTVHYMAPEVVVNGAHTTASDIWSLGVMVFEMLTGRLPFKSKTHHQLLVDLARGETKVEWPFDVLSLPANFTHFIQACLNHDPEKRPSAKQLLEHPFIRQKINSPSGSQQFNPKYMHDEDDISLDQLSEQSSVSCQPVNLIKQISEDFNEQGQVIKLKKEVADKNDKNFKTVAVQILRENWLLTSIALLMLATFVILTVVVLTNPEQEIRLPTVPEEQKNDAQIVPGDDPRIESDYNPPTAVVFGKRLYGKNIMGGVLLGAFISGLTLWYFYDPSVGSNDPNTNEGNSNGTDANTIFGDLFAYLPDLPVWVYRPIGIGCGIYFLRNSWRDIKNCVTSKHAQGILGTVNARNYGKATPGKVTTQYLEQGGTIGEEAARTSDHPGGETTPLLLRSRSVEEQIAPVIEQLRLIAGHKRENLQVVVQDVANTMLSFLPPKGEEPESEPAPMCVGSDTSEPAPLGPPDKKNESADEPAPADEPVPYSRPRARSLEQEPPAPLNLQRRSTA